MWLQLHVLASNHLIFFHCEIVCRPGFDALVFLGRLHIKAFCVLVNSIAPILSHKTRRDMTSC